MIPLVRLATPTDTSNLQQLNDTVFQTLNTTCDPDFTPSWSFTPPAQNYFSSITSPRNENFCYVVEIDDRLIGYINGSPKRYSYRTGTYLEIENLAVHPDFTNQGWGTKLLALSEDFAKSHGFNRLVLSCYAQNAAALDHYTKHGFTTLSLELQKNL